MSEKPSSRSGTIPPKDHRFGQPGANPSGDQRTAALAHATKRHATEVLAAALDADEQHFNEIVDDSATPYVVKQLLNAFRGSGTLSVAGVRALLAIWQQVFGAPTQQIEEKNALTVINPQVEERIKDNPNLAYIAFLKYPPEAEPQDLPSWVLDPRDGHTVMVLRDIPNRPPEAGELQENGENTGYSVLVVPSRE